MRVGLWDNFPSWAIERQIVPTRAPRKAPRQVSLCAYGPQRGASGGERHFPVFEPEMMGTQAVRPLRVRVPPAPSGRGRM